MNDTVVAGQQKTVFSRCQGGVRRSAVLIIFPFRDGGTVGRHECHAADRLVGLRDPDDFTHRIRETPVNSAELAFFFQLAELQVGADAEE